jgi:hypothetical protein
MTVVSVNVAFVNVVAGSQSVSAVSIRACTGKAARNVCAHAVILKAVVQVSSTLVSVLAHSAVSGRSEIAFACKTAGIISTCSKQVAVVSV